MSISAGELLKRLLNSTAYKDDDCSIFYDTLYFHDTPVIVLYHDEVIFCSSAFSTTALDLQRVMFDLMQQEGMIDQKEVFPEFQVLHLGGWTISRCRPPKPQPAVVVPVCDDTRGLL